jgi:Tol biopolymer transport system component
MERQRGRPGGFICRHLASASDSPGMISFRIGTFALLVTSIAGTPRVQRAESAPGPVFHQDLAWSPDGRRLAFSARRDSAWHIWIADLTSGRVRQLTRGVTNDEWVSWSPDGRHLAYASSAGRQPADIYVVATDGPDPPVRLTTSHGDRNSQPAWSPDGRTIAYVSKDGGPHQQIRVMRADGSAPQVLTHLDGDAESPVWSRDGTRLVFYVDSGNSRDQVWTIRADGTGLSAVTHNAANNIYPSWAPGDDVVWSRQQGDTTAVVRAHADGSHAATLLPQQSFFARVSPDGKSVAIIQGHYPATTLSICDIGGRQCRLIDPKPD